MWFQIFCIFIPHLREDEPILTDSYFSKGVGSTTNYIDETFPVHLGFFTGIFYIFHVQAINGDLVFYPANQPTYPRAARIVRPGARRGEFCDVVMCFDENAFFSKSLHPGRLTWTINMEVWKIIFLSKWVICRFHVNLPGCMMKICGCFFCDFFSTLILAFLTGRWQHQIIKYLAESLKKKRYGLSSGLKYLEMRMLC